MKKMTMALFIISIIGGCTKEKDPVTLDRESVSLYYKDSVQLRANPPSGNLIWYSSHPYHATVSPTGMVKAGKIGKATITVEQARCFVEIVPKHNLYEEPVTDWNIYKDELIAQLGKPYRMENHFVVYEYNDTVPFIFYSFDTDNKLRSAMVLIKSVYSSQLSEFLDERYTLFSMGSTPELQYFYINALRENDATLRVGMGIYNLDYRAVSYTPLLTKGDVYLHPFKEIIHSVI